MWAGGQRHYTDAERLESNDQVESVENDEHTTAYGDRFQAHFALPETEKLQATYFANLLRVLQLYGKIYISTPYLCFRSLLPGTRTKMILPLKDIENVDKATTFRLGWHGLVFMIRGHAQLFFEFGKARDRDDCAVTLPQKIG